MIGYYIHHHGRGHLSRALAIADAMDDVVTGISSLSRPARWRGPWVTLADDLVDHPREESANGRLHWVPLAAPGLRSRTAAIARWIDETRPDAMVMDVSVEVALLARLHGVPVVSVALPGVRGDAAHELGYDISSAIIGAWPPEAEGMLVGVSERTRRRVRPVGAISRFTPAIGRGGRRDERHGERPRVLVLGGGLTDNYTSDATAQRRAPEWEWSHLGGSSGRWSDNPWPEIVAADVVVTHAGESTVAEVAAARRPAVVFPQERPHHEQQRTASVLAGERWPVVVADQPPEGDWSRLLRDALRLDGDRWSAWNDGRGAARAAAVIRSVARMEGSR